MVIMVSCKRNTDLASLPGQKRERSQGCADIDQEFFSTKWFGVMLMIIMHEMDRGHSLCDGLEQTLSLPGPCAIAKLLVPGPLLPLSIISLHDITFTHEQDLMGGKAK